MAYDKFRHMQQKSEIERRVAESTRQFSDPRERDRRIRQEDYDAGWEAAIHYLLQK